MFILKSVLMCAGTGVLAKLPDVKNDEKKAHNGSTLFLQVDLEGPTTFVCATVEAIYGNGRKIIRNKGELLLDKTHTKFYARKGGSELFKFQMTDLKPYTEYDVYCVDNTDEELTKFNAKTAAPNVRSDSEKSNTDDTVFLEFDLTNTTRVIQGMWCFYTVDGTQNYIGVKRIKKPTLGKVYKFSIQNLSENTAYKVECVIGTNSLEPLTVTTASSMTKVTKEAGNLIEMINRQINIRVHSILAQSNDTATLMMQQQYF